jgi:DNA topoisomerase IB
LRGFEYPDPAGERIDDPEVLQRIAELAIPPAWREVWICADPSGHLQATGIDAAGRGASSTCTTRAGAICRIKRSLITWPTSPVRCRFCAGVSPPI